MPADLCTQCNPDLIAVFKASNDWCKEHAVPESKCTKCHPDLVAKFIEAGDYCREHGYPESVCPYCHPELVKAAGEAPPSFPEPGTLVRLASSATAKEAGIETRRIEKRRIARTLEVVGQIVFNQNRLAQLSSRAEALVQDVRVDIGDDVKTGQALVVLSSASIGADQAQLSSAKARLATARAALAREQDLAASGISPKKDVDDAHREVAAADAEYESARSALGAAGASLSSTGGHYTLAAPFAGAVVSRSAVAGRTATPGEVLIEIADLTTMWAQLEIPEVDSGAVEPGQKVTLTFEGMLAPPLEAPIARVGTSIDPETRTMRARVELPNPNRKLKAGLFVRARIQVAAEHEALLVPKEAVQRAQGKYLVFVKKQDGVFEPIAVEIVDAGGNFIEIVRGLSSDVEVVTSGAFLLKTEILKESIGAGCCEGED